MNRVLADRISQLVLRADGRLARRNLLAEGVPPERVFVTGNTVIDALLCIRERVREQRAGTARRRRARLCRAGASSSSPRTAASRSARASSACAARCSRSSSASPTSCIVYPVHLNPNVREPVNRLLGGHARIRLIEPLGYEPFVWLMDRADVVLTDSGGVQEEAPSLGKPVLVMRDTTERPEGVDAGTARLVGTDVERIVAETSLLLGDPAEYARAVEDREPLRRRPRRAAHRRRAGEGDVVCDSGHQSGGACRSCPPLCWRSSATPKAPGPDSRCRPMPPARRLWRNRRRP